MMETIYIFIVCKDSETDMLIGASLSEPHTSGTALQHVCMCYVSLLVDWTKDTYISNLHMY